MTNLCVGIRNDASIDVDLSSVDADGEDEGWNFNNLSIEEGEFLLAELSGALERARARKAVLDSRKPAPAEDKPTAPAP